MGWKLQLTYQRTVAALVLIGIAVSVPCAAWFLAAHRNLERQATGEEQGVVMTAHKRGRILAERLETRLDVLLQKENRRPFYHYQNLFHDPRGAFEGAAVSLSPLAEGAADAMIEAHFQVDDEGALSLPTLNEEFPELSLEGDHGDRCAMLAELSDIASFCAWGDTSVGGADLDALERFAMSVDDVQGHVEVMALASWKQHLQASTLYADLKNKRKPQTPSQAVDQGTEKVKVEVGPFSWLTLPVGDQLNLVALRRVVTPEGLWTQGFVVSLAIAEQYLENAYYPASFVPRLESETLQRDSQVLIPLDGTPWALALDISANLQQAVGRATEERQRFLGRFLLGALGAGLAGTLVVLLVFQSERLAHKRAQFAASAAHELRTPLAGLRLYGEMLAEGLGDPKQSQRYARRVASEAERLGRVVTNVLSFTRLERSSLTLSPAAGDLRQAVEDAYGSLRRVLDESGAEVIFDLQEATALFDRDAVVHIVHNLLDNAEKYTRDVEGRQIRVSLRTVGEQAELEVADNGPGIPASLRRRLFRPFQRVDRPDGPEGLGLGLTLVRTLARAQGGDIRYDDAPTGGAVFTVTFPLADESANLI